MGRPRYNRNDETARERLEATFWSMLAEESYQNLSVVRLCQKAHVNKNTFYYHFDNIGDLATCATDSLLEPQFVFAVFEAMQQNTQIPDCISMQEFDKRLNRLCLLADEKASPQLRSMLRDAIVRSWSTKLEIDIAGLDLPDRASFEFLIGGLMGLLAFRAREGNRISFSDVLGAAYISHAIEILDSLTDRKIA